MRRSCEVVERPLEEPAEGEVRIRVVVSGVNPTDWKSRSGAFGSAAGEPTVPNHDGAGIVDAVGSGVAGIHAGDRVWVTLAADGRPASGTAQEYTVVPAERVFPLPDGADFELGASIGIPGATAHRALTVAEDGPARLQPGALRDRTVLVAGGAGAVGNAAIQLARWAGATVIATVSSEAKAQLAGRAGAHHVVNYRDTDAADQIRRVAPAGVDVIVEVAAGVQRRAGPVRDQAPRNHRHLRQRRRDPVRSRRSHQHGAQRPVPVRPALHRRLGAHRERRRRPQPGHRRRRLPIRRTAGLPFTASTSNTAAAHDAVEGAAVGKVLITVSA